MSYPECPINIYDFMEILQQFSNVMEYDSIIRALQILPGYDAVKEMSLCVTN